MKRKTIMLNPGYSLTVFSSEQTKGRVYRLSDKPGGQPFPPVEIEGLTMIRSTTYMVATRWVIESDVGDLIYAQLPLHYLIDAPEIEAFQNPMILKWNITDLDDARVDIRLKSEAPQAFIIDWGDGTTGVCTSADDPEKAHDYTEIGEYEVRIVGQMGGFDHATTFVGAVVTYFPDPRLVEVMAWGKTGLTDCRGMFAQCENLTITAKDTPDFTNVTSVANMLQWCSSLVGPGSNLEYWDVSPIEDFASMFYRATAVDFDVSLWDVSNGTSFTNMFTKASADPEMTFTGQGIENWDVSKSRNIAGMFHRAVNFIGDVSGWNVARVVNFGYAFGRLPSFNQDLSGWNVSSGDIFSGMFLNSPAVNFDVSGWDVSNASLIDETFSGASSFEGDGLDQWTPVSIATQFVNPQPMQNFGNNSGITTANYSALLDAWSLVDFSDVSGVNLGMQGCTYNSASQPAHDILTGPPNNLNITDGGPV